MIEGRPARASSAESWLSIWGRRALTIPGFVLLAALYTALFPLLFGLAGMVDLASRDDLRFRRARATLVFALYLGCEFVGIAAALLLGLVTLGGALGGPRRYLALHAALQRLWTDTLFFGSTRIFGMRVETEGLEHVARGPLLLFVRHTSSADTVLTAAVVANPHRLLLRYVLKRELLWDPCLDLVGRRLPNAFVQRKSGATRTPGSPARDVRHPEIDAVAGLARGLDAGSAVLIYPEGTRFSVSKRDRAVEHLRERGQDALADDAAKLQNVLPPKLGGPLALFEAAPEVDVVLVEHTGFEGAATLASFWRGGLVGKTVRVRVRRFAASTIPRESRAEWLFARWAELDAWVSDKLPKEPSLGHAVEAK
ncbi:MAG: 1-acyl-sn-glycerol-3-phosphate acyltransferase [Deltaproteobacteria bacterium]|nr:1-acyl-sn-glycerol-3-phosphate acyltransferase [Deltaproteobacteria bacterium]